jgi:hypothetical protein
MSLMNHKQNLGGVAYSSRYRGSIPAAFYGTTGKIFINNEFIWPVQTLAENRVAVHPISPRMPSITQEEKLRSVGSLICLNASGSLKLTAAVLDLIKSAEFAGIPSYVVSRFGAELPQDLEEFNTTGIELSSIGIESMARQLPLRSEIHLPLTQPFEPQGEQL